MTDFKEQLKKDIYNVFLNVEEFAETHTINGKEVPALIDDMEVVEREKRMRSHMDGLYVRQTILYVAAADYGPLPGIGKTIVIDGRRFLVGDATSEGGMYAITLEANRS